MKKVLAFTMALVLLLMMAVETAFASAVCDICGRGHAGAKCPEECWEQCSMNSAGERHKYYECPDFVGHVCSYCGEKTEGHNKYTCPNGYLVWNDYQGQFRAAGTQEEGVRTPQYCGICAHYGYHSEAECRNGNVNVPESTTSDTIRVQCTHKWTQVKDPISEQMRDGDPHYCREGIYTCKTICLECGWVGNQYTTESKVPHEYSEEGKCVTCGYEPEQQMAETQESLLNNIQFDSRISGWIGIGAIVVLAVIWFIKRR